jgi:hypothetical protein
MQAFFETQPSKLRRYPVQQPWLNGSNAKNIVFLSEKQMFQRLGGRNHYKYLLFL